MKLTFNLFAVTLLLIVVGCGESGNHVVESAADPDSMSLSPGASSESMEESANAIESSMNPLAD